MQLGIGKSGVGLVPQVALWEELLVDFGKPGRAIELLKPPSHVGNEGNT